MPLFKNQIIPLKILSLSSDGNGVGKYDGQAVFVPFAAPQDEILCKIVKVSNSYAFGIIDSFHRESACRVSPECSLFGRCGGCLLRHISYEAELAAKQSFVADAMLRLGGIELAVSNIIPSPSAERYRNKVQLPVFTDANGNVHAGFFAGRSHRIIECDDCRLQPEIFTRISARTCELLTQYKLSTHDEIKHLGLVRHIYMRYSVQYNKVMLCLVINGKKLPYQEDIVKALTSEFPELETIVLNINRESTNVILGNKNIVLYGEGTLSDELCGVPVKLNPLSFFQVNTLGAQQLYAMAALLANPSHTDVLLDLYCGAGTIGLSMAHECKELIGVEIIPEAIDGAIKSAQQMELTNTRFICGDAGKAADSLQKSGQKADIVIVDPPRKGCDELTLSAITQMRPKRIVMVSCNASTAARDCRILVKQGYTVAAIQPVDMFPRTRHVEAIILMTYCGDKPKK